MAYLLLFTGDVRGWRRLGAAGVDQFVEAIFKFTLAAALRRAANAREMRAQEALHLKLLLRLFVAKKSRHPQETPMGRWKNVVLSSVR